MSEDQISARENSAFELETETLGRIRCRPFDLKLLFRFVDLIKLAPDTVRDCVCSLISVVGERWNATVPEDGGISRDQARTLTNQELEQFAARFLEAANWIETGGTGGPKADGRVECSYGERLKLALKTYEQSLAKQTKLDPEAEKPFYGSAGDALSGFRNDGPARWDRSFGLVSNMFEVARGQRKWQRLNSGPSQCMERSVRLLKLLKEDLVDGKIIPFRALQNIGRQLKKIALHMKTLRSKSSESGIKAVHIRLVVAVIIIGLLTPLVSELIALRHSSVKEFAAIVNLTNTVHNLSEKMDAQIKALAELMKQRDSERRIAAQQTTHLDSKRQTRPERRQRPTSSSGPRHRKAVDMPTSPLRVSHK